nr:hypothetical protein [Tanacetum cinerariifolium]
MARLQFYDYHNMIIILEKSEHNADFHPLMDFIEASPLRYAFTVKPTVYISHIKQVWSTARIETTDEGTQILATVDGIYRTVSESSLRRNLKLQDEEGISSLPDTELFENITLMEYNISPNQKFTFQKGQFSHQWKYLIHTIMQCLSPKSTGFNEFSSNISTALVCLATNRPYNFSKMIFDGLVKNVNNKVSKFLMYPRFLTMCLRMTQFGQITHTQKYVVPFHTKKLFTTLRVNSPSFSGRIVPLFDTMLVQQGEGSGTPTEPHHTPSPEAQSPSHTTQTSLTLPPITTTSLPTVTQSDTPIVRQYTRRIEIAQSSVLLTVADEPASPLRDVSQGKACPTDSGFIADQDRATIVKPSTLPHDSTPRVTSPIADEGSMQQTILEMTALCTSLERQLSELTAKFQAQEVEINRLKERVKMLEDREGVAATRSGDDAPIKGRSMDEGEASTKRISDDSEEMATVLTSMDAATVLASGVVDVPTGSGSIPTESTPVKEQVPTGSDVVPTASSIFATATVVTPYRRRKGKKVMVESESLKKQKVQEQIDAQVSRELEEQLKREDERKSEKIARDEYHQFALELPIERRIELITDLVKYQDNYAKIYKYQSQQRKPMTKKQKKDYYMAVIRNNLGWKMEEFIPMGSKEEAERIKRKGLSLEQESAKKQKTYEEVPEEAMSPEEVPKEKVKEMMHLIPIEEVYVEALQVKHHIIDWKEDLNQLWRLVKETLSNRPPTSDKEMEPWVELSRLYEPDNEDQLWTHIQNLMHAPVELKLYDTCGVHHVISKDKEIFMLVEKDYPLRKGLALVMISYKLQLENYSQMANDLILKIYKIANSTRQQEQLPTASEERCHCQKKSEATARKIALLSKVKKKLVVITLEDPIINSFQQDSMDEGEAATERINDDSEEMATVLTSMDAATVLASGVVDVPTSSGSIPSASTPAEEQVPTGSDVVPTASLVFATATVVTPYRRRKGKEVMRRSEQIARNAEIARIHAEEKLQIMIDCIDKNNETVAKYLQEYHQFASELPIERRIELITDLVKSQDNYAKIYKYESQQRKPMIKKQKRDYYMAVIRNNLGWKVKNFREEVPDEAMSPKEVLEKKVKEMMHLVHIEEVYVEALQVKHPIIDWKDKENFMLVEKDNPLRKGLALVMISYKLQVENYSQMANDLILKIYKIVNSPRQQEQLPTASEERCHWQRKSEATARKIALLSKVKKKQSVKVK